MAVLPALAFVYFDGPEVYVHPCEIRSTTTADLRWDPHCIAECETPILAGQTIIVTDPGDQGEATAHLACLLATGSSAAVMTLWEAERVQSEVGTGKREA